MSPNCFISKIKFKILVCSKSLVVFFIIFNCNITYLVPSIIKHYDLKTRFSFVSHSNLCYIQTFLFKWLYSKIFFTPEEIFMKTFGSMTLKLNIQRIQMLVIGLHNQWFQAKFPILCFVFIDFLESLDNCILDISIVILLDVFKCNKEFMIEILWA